MSGKKLSSVTHIFWGILDHNGSLAAIDHNSLRFLILRNEVTSHAWLSVRGGAVPALSHACVTLSPLAPELSPRHGAGDHVIGAGNISLLSVSWEERKGRKEKRQLVKSSSHAKKKKRKQRENMNQKSWFHSGILQSDRALASAVSVCVCCGAVWCEQMQSEYITIF